MMPMAEGHKKALERLVDEWGTLGVLSVLLDDLPEATAESVIEAYRQRRLRDTAEEKRDMSPPGGEGFDAFFGARGAVWTMDDGDGYGFGRRRDWFPTEDAAEDAAEPERPLNPVDYTWDGWLRVAERVWKERLSSPWRRRGHWLWRTWTIEPLAVEGAIIFRRDLGGPSVFRLRVSGSLVGRLEIRLNGVVVDVVRGGPTPTDPAESVTFHDFHLEKALSFLNLGENEIAFRLTGFTLGNALYGLSARVIALPPGKL